jgi:hypothetical protein
MNKHYNLYGLKEQEGHDGPEVAHLYIGPRSGVSLNPRAFIWTNLVDIH